MLRGIWVVTGFQDDQPYLQHGAAA